MCVCVCVYIRAVQVSLPLDETDGTNRWWPNSIPLSVGYGSSLSETDSEKLSGQRPPPKPELPDPIEKQTLESIGFYSNPATFRPFTTQIQFDVSSLRSTQIRRCLLDLLKSSDVWRRFSQIQRCLV